MLLFYEYSLVKTIRFDNIRTLGNPTQAVKVYNARDVDELVFLDIGAPRNQTSIAESVVSEIASECFMPLTVGGGIKDVSQMRQLLKIGADKIAVNTEAFLNPNLIKEGANKFGSQAVVVSIDAKKAGNDYEVYIQAATKNTKISVVSWAKKVNQLGAGEILLTSIDEDGKMTGYDIDLIKLVSNSVSIPIIAAGGAGEEKHFAEAITLGGADAVAAASIFHYTQHTPKSIKQFMHAKGIPVRL